MIPVIFSIPIHEKLEVVLDQIRNYKFFNPDCGIVLHISKNFDYVNSGIAQDEFVKEINRIGNIFLNSTSVRTKRCDMIQAHLANFCYLNQQCEFEYFALCASNELFIRSGLYQWIREYDCGMDLFDVPENDDEWFQSRHAWKDTALKNILKEIKGDKIIGAQMEGSFFKRDLFDGICEVINRNYDYKLMEDPYAREEVYFSTIIGNWINNGKEIRIYKAKPFTYIPWEKHLKVEIEDIEHLREQNSQFFSVKRIERDINDPVRSYIREEAGNGYPDYKTI